MESITFSNIFVYSKNNANSLLQDLYTGNGLPKMDVLAAFTGWQKYLHIVKIHEQKMYTNTYDADIPIVPFQTEFSVLQCMYA